MPKIPITLRRSCRLLQILRHQRTQAMSNLPPFPANTVHPPVYFIQSPLSLPQRSSTHILNRIRSNGICNNFECDGKWSGDGDSSPKFSLPCTISVRGHATCNEQLHESCMDQQYHKPVSPK